MAAPSLGVEPAAPTDDELLGKLLVDAGLLTEEDCQKALSVRTDRGQDLARILMDDSLVSETDLVATLARHLKLEFVDLTEYPGDAAAARLVSDTMARRYLALPIGWS